MNRRMSIGGRWFTYYRVQRQQRHCQFHNKVTAVYGDAGIIWLSNHAPACTGMNLVLSARPFSPPQVERCTLLCDTHWRWALTNIRASIQLGLLDPDWHLDAYRKS